MMVSTYTVRSYLNVQNKQTGPSEVAIDVSLECCWCADNISLVFVVDYVL